MSDTTQSSRLDSLLTEATDPTRPPVDTLTVPELVRLMNERDREIPRAVEQALPEITSAVSAASLGMRAGGRLFYVGAGTSGRLGVLDASEIPPTFGTDPAQVVGIIAGGPAALVRSAESAEDSAADGAKALMGFNLHPIDTVVGIASSGRTPFVLGAVQYAAEHGATTIGLSCTPHAELSEVCKFPIEVPVGPEIVTGSTRLGAGTATKMVLNMISTICMIRLGKTYGSLMVDVRATNKKLVHRAIRIVQQAAGVDEETARDALQATDWHAKLAIAVLASGTDVSEARRRLDAADGVLRRVIEGAAEPEEEGSR